MLSKKMEIPARIPIRVQNYTALPHRRSRSPVVNVSSARAERGRLIPGSSFNVAGDTQIRVVSGCCYVIELMISVLQSNIRLFLMVRGMKFGSHVKKSPTQVVNPSIKTEPYSCCENIKMSLMFGIRSQP